MKKRTLVRSGAVAGSVLLVASLLSGCGPVAPTTVYGPPPEPLKTESPGQVTENIPAPVYGPPTDVLNGYDPAENIPEDVYGPPSVFEEPNEEPAEAGETQP